MNKKNILFLLLFVFLLTSIPSLACTSFLVGRDASADGSTFITYNADSYYLYGSLTYKPATKHQPNETIDIYGWNTGKFLGKIKEMENTYAVVGNMNEYQLSIAESTFGGRRELVDTTGILDYGNLIYLTLQRAKTAREAIKTISDLVNKYGYQSEGESFSIADPYEVWIMEMVGKGAYNKGAVWVAQCIPDDCVSAHANQARITTFPFDDKEHCLYSDDVVAFAREKGYFKGKNKDFSFSDTYAPLDYSQLRACESRVWSFFRKINPSMDKYISYIKGETSERMPLWVKPSTRLTAQKLKDYMRDQFEGTEFDLTKGVGAGPFGSKLRCSPLNFQVDSIQYLHERPTATQQTGFTFVAQMRNWLPDYIGGILWFGVDDAATSLYVPMYCCINRIPECFDETNGSLLEYSPTSAFWIYNQVSNLAYTKYLYMLPDIQQVQAQWENDFNALVPAMDKVASNINEKEARIFLTNFSNSQADNSTNAWKKLYQYLLIKYLDGNIKRENNGRFVQNSHMIPEDIIRPGYPAEYLRLIVKENKGLRIKSEAELNSRP